MSILCIYCWENKNALGPPKYNLPSRAHNHTILHALGQNLHAKGTQACLNTLRLRQNECHFADDIFKCIFVNENVWIPVKISLKYVPKGPINNIPALVQIMAWRRSGMSHYLNQWWLVYRRIYASLGLSELMLSRGMRSQHWFTMYYDSNHSMKLSPEFGNYRARRRKSNSISFSALLTFSYTFHIGPPG